MQITRMGGLKLVLTQHLKVHKLALKIPLEKALQPDLQKLHPSRQGLEYIYHQIPGRK